MAVAALWVYGVYDARPRQLIAITILAYLACWAIFFAVSVHDSRRKAIRFAVVNLSLVMAIIIVEVSAVSGLVRSILESSISTPFDRVRMLAPLAPKQRRPAM